jgi:hypothetical protein
MGNWWFDDQGKNNLKGVPGDDSNKVVLPDSSIIGFMLEVPLARRDFKLIVPTMLPLEQDRLNALVAQNPRILELEPNLDPGIQDDRLMQKFNTPGFHDPNRRKR